jgi:hypothetical protein
VAGGQLYQSLIILAELTVNMKFINVEWIEHDLQLYYTRILLWIQIRLKEAAEKGLLLFVKYALVVLLSIWRLIIHD